MACGLTVPSPSVPKPETQPPANSENQTPLEMSPPEQAADEAEWSTVQIFTGKESETTPPFYISGAEWRILWTADFQSPEYVVFDILIYSQDKAGMLTKRISYSEGTPNGTVYIYEGGCEYYLKVITANLSNWTITVEDHGTQNFTSPVQITKIHYKGTKSSLLPGTIGHLVIESDEYVEIKNPSDSPQDIGGWVLKNLTKGGPVFVFPLFQPCSCDLYSKSEDCLKYCYPQRLCAIEPHMSIRVYTGELHYESGGFCFYYFWGNIWDNETPDTAVLYNSEGQEVSRKSYIISTKDSVALDK
jgi:hypothetical protein